MAAWGNALGGWMSQPRIAGRFAAKNLSSKALHAKAKKRGGGFVPYRRHGLGHNTVGVNSGFGVTKNRRVSMGFYVRTDTKSGQKRAMKIAKAQEHAQLAATRKVRGIPFADTRGAKLTHVKRVQNRIFRKLVGGEKKKGSGPLGTAYSRIGTDRNSLPTYIVRYNSPKDKSSRKGALRKRNKAIVAYNVRSVTGKRTFDWTQKPKNSRPQRRNSAAKAGVLL